MSIDSIRKYHYSRRKFLQATAGTAALAAAAAKFPFMGSQQAFAASLADQELRTVGLSVTVQERILNDFKEKSGVKAVSGKADIFPDTQTELLSGSTAYDCWETIGERLAAGRRDRQDHGGSDRQSEELGQHPRHLHQAVGSTGISSARSSARSGRTKDRRSCG